MVLTDWNVLIGPVLSVAVLAVAVLLSLRQWAEGRVRPEGLSADDRRHFARQDVRRFQGAAVMALIGLGIAWGTLLDPKGDDRTKHLFLYVWLGVILLVLLLVTLALLDLLATRHYARRHRRALAAERREALKAEFQRRATPRDSRNGPDGQSPRPVPPAGE